MNLLSYPLGTLIAVASQETKKLSEQLLSESLSITGNHRFQNVAFISTVIKQKTFHKIALSNEEQLVYNAIEKPEVGSICLPKNALFFLDLPDKSLCRNDDGVLDIEHIHKIMTALKNNYNVQTFIIDNIDKVDCSLMGRDLLWKTNRSNLSNYEDWRERKHEYIISLLFFISRKLNVRIIFGKEMKQTTTLQKELAYIKYMNFGFAAEIIDEIMVWNEHQDLHKLNN